MFGAGTVTPLTVNTTNTLTVDFLNYFQGTSYSMVSTSSGTATTINAFSFTNALSQGQYTIILGITYMAGSGVTTLTVTAPVSTIYRCNFTSVSVSTSSTSGTQTNPKYIVLTVTYDANPPNSTRWFISASGFNN